MNEDDEAEEDFNPLVNNDRVNYQASGAASGLESGTQSKFGSGNV